MAVVVAVARPPPSVGTERPVLDPVAISNQAVAVGGVPVPVLVAVFNSVLVFFVNLIFVGLSSLALSRIAALHGARGNYDWIRNPRKNIFD